MDVFLIRSCPPRSPRQSHRTAPIRPRIRPPARPVATNTRGRSIRLLRRTPVMAGFVPIGANIRRQNCWGPAMTRGRYVSSFSPPGIRRSDIERYRIAIGYPLEPAGYGIAAAAARSGTASAPRPAASSASAPML